jgi:ABC-type nitrate/sulfonate/bicarbonate transport system ATPase subunit
MFPATFQELHEMTDKYESEKRKVLAGFDESVKEKEHVSIINHSTTYEFITGS